jgi:hypothetical protein
MSLASIGRNALRLQYQVACLPLRLVERQTRMFGTDSPVHLLAERAVATLDGTVGRLLGDGGLRRQGEREGQRVDALSRATRLERDAQRRRSEAERRADEASRRAHERREQAREQQRERVSSAVREEQADRRKVDERAGEDAKSDKRAADAKAHERERQAREEQKQKEERAQTRAERASEESKRELKAAAEQRKDAAERRGDAERLDELADHERDDRRKRANGSR